ncbi:MAG: NAD(P)/FAD-dependent oxidoreductase [Ilumatobacteraceae bacterium]
MHGAIDKDVVVIGAGITGIHALHQLVANHFDVQVLEAGAGVGGTWYWNRYPRARFDSESYSYGYFFSEEIKREWDWSEMYAGQPEIEQYLNFVVDRFGLRDRIRFGARVDGVTFDEAAGTWTVRTADGFEVRSRFVVAATGILSIPYRPPIEGAESFGGEQYHTGQWPAQEVSFEGKRVAVIGSGSSGVQLIPAVAESASHLVVLQRTPNWCAPLNNQTFTAAEQEAMRATIDDLDRLCRTTFTGMPHVSLGRSAFDDDKEQRWATYERLWEQGHGHRLWFGNYDDASTSRAANDDFCEFLSAKIRSLVDDPDVARRLTPNDHGFGAKRPPLVNGYYETFNLEHVELVDLREDPIVRILPNGIETQHATYELDMIVWATGFDAVTGALTRLGVTGVGGRRLADAWADGPFTFLGLQTPGFPNLFIVGGPHATQGNIPRSTEIHVDVVVELLEYMRTNGLDRIEADERAAAEWTAHVYDAVADDPDSVHVAGTNWSYGSNIPGKPERLLMYRHGLPTYRSKVAASRDAGYRGWNFSTHAEPEDGGR